MSSAPSGPDVHYLVSAFYHFVALDTATVATVADEFRQLGESRLRGLLIVSPEGVNGTVAGLAPNVEILEAALCRLLPEGDRISFKHSHSTFQPFRRWKVDVRPQSVTFLDGLPLPAEQRRHLSPDEFHRALLSEDAVVVDVRNSYEIELGAFKGAVDPGTQKFTEFPDFLRQSDIAPDRKVLIYCTGGIRCEKAIYEFERQGFQNVFQLEGGILNYLAHYPHGLFEGECFVFDHRVALDQHLKPSQRYGLCAHCGQPAERSHQCLQCGEATRICARCEGALEHITCSKNCAYHLTRSQCS